jgi:hypothetical protein
VLFFSPPWQGTVEETDTITYVRPNQSVYFLGQNHSVFIIQQVKENLLRRRLGVLLISVQEWDKKNDGREESCFIQLALPGTFYVPSKPHIISQFVN